MRPAPDCDLYWDRLPASEGRRSVPLPSIGVGEGPNAEIEQEGVHPSGTGSLSSSSNQRSPMPGPLKTDPDRDLILECQRSLGEGFGGAFRQVYELYKDRVYNVCYRVTGNATDALDASQETFGIVHRKISAFRFESRFSSWVYRIAVNTSIDLKRRQGSRRLASLEAVTGANDGDGGRFDLEDGSVELPPEVASRRELEAEVQRAIGRLSPKLRSITVLRYIESLSYDEISETLDISLGTVKSRLSRAHAAMDRELTPVLHKHYLS